MTAGTNDKKSKSDIPQMELVLAQPYRVSLLLEESAIL